jgi:predicted secreted hydrolase
LLACLGLAPARAQAWLPARPDFAWSFPRDHWSHPGYRTEWWYFTGHLESAAGRRFGYQFTFFRVGLLPSAPEGASAWNTADLLMGHAAISDLDGGTHRFSELVVRAMPLLGGFGAPPERLLVWSRAPPGTDGRWTLEWNGDGFDFSMQDDARGMAFTLHTTAAKPRVFQGPDGFSRKGEAPGSASLYYSFPRLATRGSLTLDGTSFPVSGQSWMDKEFGSNQLEESQVGWDWFSLQLADGREVMLYHLRDAEGRTVAARGTLVEEDGAARYFEAGDWSLETTDRWHSDATDTTYPAGWKLVFPAAGLDVRVTPELADQENRSRLFPRLHYWEGAVRVTDPEGRPLGVGYAELTGYGDGSRPGI